MTEHNEVRTGPAASAGTEFAALAALSDLRRCSICGKTFKGDACPGASEWDAALKAHVHPANVPAEGASGANYPPAAGSVACPSCGGRLPRTVEQGAGWQGECTACHMRGPWRETEAAALEAWLSFADPVDTQNNTLQGSPEAKRKEIP